MRAALIVALLSVLVLPAARAAGDPDLNIDQKRDALETSETRREAARETRERERNEKKKEDKGKLQQDQRRDRDITPRDRRSDERP